MEKALVSHMERFPVELGVGKMNWLRACRKNNLLLVFAGVFILSYVMCIEVLANLLALKSLL
ncbi:MAG: hypothetical protein QG632_348 [Candidatus Dependentiae bacterium]|nr:hypothetical protein [Candidatus Dependentiae bacterium]